MSQGSGQGFPHTGDAVSFARRTTRSDPPAPAVSTGTDVAKFPGVDGRTHDASVAIRNTLSLGGGLTVTWLVALVVRIFLPRYLGPGTFGDLSFAEAFATAFFVLAALGVDTYIRTEVPVRPSHGNDFFGGILVLRLALTGVIVLLMYAIVVATHRSPTVRMLVLVFAGQQAFFVVNESLAALLHANGRVGGLAGVNVASKLVWASCIAAAVAGGGALVGIAGGYIAAEAFKSTLLYRLCRKHVDLRLHVDLRAAMAVVFASLPFYLNFIARNIYARVDVSLLAFTSPDVEVGWYGAANTLANIALLIAPVFNWVLLPLFARAAARSDADLTRTIHRSVEIVQVVAIPVALMMGLGADVWVRLLFGQAYAPAAFSLRVLAPLCALTYVATIGAQWLTVLQRPWRVTAISSFCMLLNPVLVLALIGPCLRHFGPGGGGAGCALAQLATELTVVTLYLLSVGARALDRRTLSVLGRSLAACGGVVLLDQALSDMGPARLAVDIGAYVALALLFRAVKVRETAEFARLALRRHELAS